MNEWISVYDRMPEKDGLYLITVKYYFVNGMNRSTKLCKYNSGSIDCCPTWYRDSLTGYPESAETDFEKVIAWMPIPEPYTGDMLDAIT